MKADELLASEATLARMAEKASNSSAFALTCSVVLTRASSIAGSLFVIPLACSFTPAKAASDSQLLSYPRDLALEPP